MLVGRNCDPPAPPPPPRAPPPSLSPLLRPPPLSSAPLPLPESAVSVPSEMSLYRQMERSFLSAYQCFWSSNYLWSSELELQL